MAFAQIICNPIFFSPKNLNWIRMYLLPNVIALVYHTRTMSTELYNSFKFSSDYFFFLASSVNTDFNQNYASYDGSDYEIILLALFPSTQHKNSYAMNLRSNWLFALNQCMRRFFFLPTVQFMHTFFTVSNHFIIHSHTHLLVVPCVKSVHELFKQKNQLNQKSAKCEQNYFFLCF